jgi:DNA-binding GntR family transcriptional regulator
VARSKQSTNGEVFEKLREMILNFELYPGSRITETELAERFSVSRTPIREALQRLAYEGHIVIMPKQGCFVRNIDIDELTQHYRVRIALEMLSLEVACAEMGDAELEALAEDWDPVEQKGRTDNSEKMEARDECFHIALAEGGGNKALAHYLQQVNSQIRVIRRLDFTNSDRIDRTYAEHHEIVQQLLRRDLEGAKALMTTHITRSEEFAKSLTLRQLARPQASM